jgi:hypothetical protein
MHGECAFGPWFNVNLAEFIQLVANVSQDRNYRAILAYFQDIAKMFPHKVKIIDHVVFFG